MIHGICLSFMDDKIFHIDYTCHNLHRKFECLLYCTATFHRRGYIGPTPTAILFHTQNRHHAVRDYGYKSCVVAQLALFIE
uniref:Uncharacterized protein n=1 Tax=Romanomermis culicivorax TaxID=13658 RepID=A0A915KJT6_ROMCU